MTERKLCGDSTRKTQDSAARTWYMAGKGVDYTPPSYHPGGGVKPDGAQNLKGTEYKHSGPDVRGTENKHSGPSMGGSQNQHSGKSAAGSENQQGAAFKT